MFLVFGLFFNASVFALEYDVCTLPNQVVKLSIANAPFVHLNSNDVKIEKINSANYFEKSLANQLENEIDLSYYDSATKELVFLSSQS